jgi:DNA primase
MGEDAEKLKQRWPLLDYLQQQNWVAQPAGYDSEFVGLCPLHEETRPSFYVNARKNLFYCQGCGQGVLSRATRAPEIGCSTLGSLILLGNR